MIPNNKSVYESNDLARQYGLEDALQPPEQTILDAMKERLAGACMLDAGVGGGRTTGHFAPLVGSYVGIDYSEQMIAICKERFREISNRLTFQVADVRSMPIFPDGSFDFVLFSYNGLDYIPHQNRLNALSEIRRVLKRGGHLALSTHNLNSLRNRLRPGVSLNPRVMASRVLWVYRFLRHNGWSLSMGKASHCEVYDGALGFRLQTHYVTPECAIDELARAGFRDIRTFDLAKGCPILGVDELRTNSDDWLYFLGAV